jgi:hypothetical protein
MYLQNPYIVFDVRNTWFSHLEPHALTRPDREGRWLQDGPIWDTNINGLNPQFDILTAANRTSLFNGLPRMVERFGSDVGDMVNTMTSYHINDMWTINENHSVMLGLRADSFTLKDSERTVHSYTKITPRLEYKYDILGDQKHLFAASYAQFHQMAPMTLYLPFVQTKWGNTNTRLWTGDAVDGSKKQTGYYLVNQSDILNPDNYGLIQNTTYSGAQFGDVDKDFVPATAIEYAAWYRHTFQNGGYIKVGYSTRTWSDLYDYFPGEPFEPGAARLKTILKNTDAYDRTYGLFDVQWDFPITRKVVFGGSYSQSSFKSNQGTSVSTTDFLDLRGGQPVATPEWFDERLSRDVVINGNVVWSGQGKDTWRVMRNQDPEFRISYYLIVNLTQGRARSNFTLRGMYTGSSTNYETIDLQVGYALVGSNPNPLGNNTQLNIANSARVPYMSYTNNGTFYNSFAYNLNMPLAKTLSWFINININNVFNHIPRSIRVPTTTGTVTRPWMVSGDSNDPLNGNGNPNNWSTVGNVNPLRDGWTWIGSDTGNLLTARAPQLRSIVMSTGLRF